ncbi:NAD(P)-dependent alcohol dehydrogenase [Plantactinospora endophytica]|uniref:NADPH:quinone reductase n=1 Tax=Plantactinospora endophytica TaxID=673535 RepID=A0ABQ4E0E4_9ACTN|nr:NAD(P)-dependent alcohol dehydrogenase [Plantactinospora endophytica]GIG88192.1 NADPH:quinone reductase [Plantactinospora endophytica]
MKAIIHDEYGPPGVLRYGDVDMPTAGEHEVLVRVRAASVNHGDRVWLHGLPRAARLATGLRRPNRTVLGRAVAGTVEAVGPGVTRFAVGDAVFGEVNQRGFAEYAAVPEDRLARRPDGVTHEQAATLPVAATTALQAVRRADLRPGRSLLVNGASGGVGTFTVQLAKVRGAMVTAVCSTRNVELARSLGADHVVDYTREDVAGVPARFDAVIDFAGSQRLAAVRRLLTPTGVYVCSTGTGGPLLGPLPRLVAVTATTPFVRQRLRVLAATTRVADLDEVAGLVAAGRITPVIERTYPLGEAAEALHLVETVHARGKIVLTV